MWTFLVLAQRGNTPDEGAQPLPRGPHGQVPGLATGVSVDLKVQYPSRNPELVPEIPTRGFYLLRVYNE